ncbi:MAG: PfkB family carbohydrate kinase [Oscillospiraceae bacterium]|nr:PfkB family carbohydrate kinase [Oscillospiraceae bacterium]
MLLPNADEAALLLGKTPAPVRTESDAAALLAALCARGAKKTAITGLHLQPGRIAVAARSGGATFYIDNPQAPCKLFGTGDLFSAAATAALVRGRDFASALRIACDFAALCAARTAEDESRDPRFGVRFEDSLPDFIEMLRG